MLQRFLTEGKNLMQKNIKAVPSLANFAWEKNRNNVSETKINLPHVQQRTLCSVL